MYPYYLMIFIPCIIDLIRIKIWNPQSRKRLSIIVFFSILFLLIALKGLSVGSDTYNYLYKFSVFSRGSWLNALTMTTEPAFNLLNKFVSVFTSEFQIMEVVIAAITVIPIAVYYAKEVEIPILTIALFLIQSNFEMLFTGYRQCIAISLGIIAFEMMRRKKPIIFLLIVALAFLFHNSAFMLLLMYPLYHFKINKKRMFIVVPVIVLIFVFNRQIFSLIRPIFSDLYTMTTRSTGAYMMLLLFIAFAIICFWLPQKGSIDADTNGLRNFLLMALIVQMFAAIHPLAMRMGSYYSVFIPILIPRIILKSRRWRQVAILAAIVMTVYFIVFFLVRTPSHNSLHIYPYHFFWEGVR